MTQIIVARHLTLVAAIRRWQVASANADILFQIPPRPPIMTQLASTASSSEKLDELPSSPTSYDPTDGANLPSKTSKIAYSKSFPAPPPLGPASPGNLRTAARRKGTPWCRAAILTMLIVFAAYVWLSWTDPDQVEMRKQAWEAAMERIRGKQVVYAQRYSDQHRFRPAASPIITEVLSDGRKKIRGGRHGDDIPLPKPTATAVVKKNRRRQKKRKN